MSRRILFAVAIVCAAGSALAQSAGRTTWDGVFTKAQAARGEAIYLQHCAGCHGSTLGGGEGPPLTGADFGTNWNGLALSELADRIRSAMPPDNPGKLSPQQRTDVIAFVLQVSQFPAGESELPSDTAALTQIRYQASRPQP